MSKKAVILGASGLVGSELLKLLLEDDRYEQVVAYVRAPLSVEHPRLTEVVGDLFDDNLFEGMTADELFCCIGTTQSKTPDLHEYKEIDFGIPVRAARAGIKGGMKRFLVISSLGADPTRKTFYLRVKGQMEDALKKMAIPKLYIFRPSLLMGDREEFRFGEKVAAGLMKVFSFAVPKRYKGIDGELVARAMLNVANSTDSSRVFESDEIYRIAQAEVV